MKKVSPLFISTLFLLALNQCSAQTKSERHLDDAKKAIAESNMLYFQAFAKNDSSIFIQRYSDDCLIMNPNAHALTGSKGALEFFKGAYHRKGIRDGKFITQEVYGINKDYIVELGAFKLMDAKGFVLDDGKYLVLWKKTENGWKMFRDSFNSNRQ